MPATNFFDSPVTEVRRTRQGKLHVFVGGRFTTTLKGDMTFAAGAKLTSDQWWQVLNLLAGAA